MCKLDKLECRFIFKFGLAIVIRHSVSQSKAGKCKIYCPEMKHNPVFEIRQRFPKLHVHYHSSFVKVDVLLHNRNCNSKKHSLNTY